jgi:hypothetical protein
MSMEMKNRSGFLALTCSSRVELPGIESGTETLLTSVNLGFQYAKARESTRNDLRIRGRC